MGDRKSRRETQRVVGKVVKVVEGHDSIGKAEFEVILGRIIEQVHKNTGVAVEKIAEKTRKVIQDLPEEYGQMSKDERSWEAMITYLYKKYLRELGVL